MTHTDRLYSGSRTVVPWWIDRERVRRVWSAAIVVIVVVFAGITPARSQDVPSILQIIGEISSGSSGVAPVAGDEVRVIDPASGRLEGAGTILDDSGTFFIEMSKSVEFNGRQLSLRLAVDGEIRELLFGSDNTFTFSGSFPFPSRITINPTIGDVVASGDGGTDGNGNGGSDPADDGEDGDDDLVDPPPPSEGVRNDAFDVNGDGLFNQADVDAIKEAITAENLNTSADVNQDGIVNTRDAISAIKALRAGADRAGNLPSLGDASIRGVETRDQDAPQPN